MLTLRQETMAGRKRRMDVLKALHILKCTICNDLFFMAARQDTVRCLTKLITGIGTDRKNTK